MTKFEFRKIFSWIPWITLLVLAGWGGLFVLDFLHMTARDIGVLVVFLGIMLLTFAVDSLMTENPEKTGKYFTEWLVICGILIFFAFTIWVWFS